MKIKEPVLVYKKVNMTYVVDVEGQEVVATYTYDIGDEMNDGWDYDLSPCYEGLNDDEILDLEEEFEIVILDLEV
jgi:hypothetical protein